MDDRYWVRLNPFEIEYMENNKIKFSEFVHDSFYRSMKKSYFRRLKDAQYKVFMILLGMILIALMYTTINPLVYMGFMIMGMVSICTGFFSIMWELKNAR